MSLLIIWGLQSSLSLSLSPNQLLSNPLYSSAELYPIYSGYESEDKKDEDSPGGSR